MIRSMSAGASCAAASAADRFESEAWMPATRRRSPLGETVRRESTLARSRRARTRRSSQRARSRRPFPDAGIRHSAEARCKAGAERFRLRRLIRSTSRAHPSSRDATLAERVGVRCAWL